MAMGNSIRVAGAAVAIIGFGCLIGLLLPLPEISVVKLGVPRGGAHVIGAGQQESPAVASTELDDLLRQPYSREADASFREAVERWASRDPLAVMRWLQANPRVPFREFCLECVTAGAMAKEVTEEALALSSALPDGWRLRGLLTRALLDRVPPRAGEAYSLMRRFGSSPPFFAECLRSISSSDPDLARKLLDDQPPAGLSAAAYCSGLLSGLPVSELPALLRLHARKVPLGQYEEFCGSLLRARRDLAADASVIEELVAPISDPNTKIRIASRFIAAGFNRETDNVDSFLTSPDTLPYAHDVALSLVPELLKNDPAKAWQAAAFISHPDSRRHYLTQAADAIAAVDPVKAWQLAESMPVRADGLSALEAVTYRWCRTSPVDAIGRVLESQIEDPGPLLQTAFAAVSDHGTAIPTAEFMAAAANLTPAKAETLKAAARGFLGSEHARRIDDATKDAMRGYLNQD